MGLLEGLMLVSAESLASFQLHRTEIIMLLTVLFLQVKQVNQLISWLCIESFDLYCVPTSSFLATTLANDEHGWLLRLVGVLVTHHIRILLELFFTAQFSKVVQLRRLGAAKALESRYRFLVHMRLIGLAAHSGQIVKHMRTKIAFVWPHRLRLLGSRLWATLLDNDIDEVVLHW